jgi:hypothetical protein
MKAFIVIMLAMAALCEVIEAVLASGKVGTGIVLSMETWLLWFAVIALIVLNRLSKASSPNNDFILW